MSNDFPLVRLGDVCELLMGNSPPGETYNDTGNGLPLINGPADFGPKNPMPVKWTTAPTRKCRVGDVLICVRGNTTGRLSLADSEYCIGRGVGAIRGRQTLCSTEYLFFILLRESRRILELATGGGSTFPNINKPQLEQLQIPLPPLPEQRAIAHVLRTVQRAKEATEKLIASVRQLRSSLITHLLTWGPVSPQGVGAMDMYDSDVGLIPRHWEITALATHTRQCAFGPRFSGEYYDADGNVATLRTTDMSMDGQINYSTMPRARLDLQRFKSHLLEPNDFLVSRTGAYCGMAAVFEGFDSPVLAGAFLIRIVLRESLSARFLAYYFNSAIGRERVTALGTGAAQKNINGTSLKQFRIPVPPLPEQSLITNFISTLDKKIATEGVRRASLQRLFDSLLHNLMTGKVRVHDLALAEAAGTS